MFDFFNNLKENEIKNFYSGNFKKLIRIQKKLRIKKNYVREKNLRRKKMEKIQNKNKK